MSSREFDNNVKWYTNYCELKKAMVYLYCEVNHKQTIYPFV